MALSMTSLVSNYLIRCQAQTQTYIEKEDPPSALSDHPTNCRAHHIHMALEVDSLAMQSM